MCAENFIVNGRQLASCYNARVLNCCHLIQMQFVVKLFPEITIKSPPVRKRFIRQLRDNLKILTKSINPEIRVTSDWEKLDIYAPDTPAELDAEIIDLLNRTPGIANFSPVIEFPLTDFEDILIQLKNLWRDNIAEKTFCVRVKRTGDHSFTSVDAEKYLGGGLLHQTAAAGVKLKNPDLTIRLEIRRDRVFLIKEKIEGLGGFPLGSQDPVLSLISGGFDSTVSSFLTTKRGICTHFCFFNLGGQAHEIAVKEIAFYLWNRFGASHSVKFVTIPFEDVVAEILEKIDNPLMGVVLKRMMLRAASAVAHEMNIPALVTGESVAQVSSQTLPNLCVIDSVTDTLVLRPLITADKTDIIRTAREIGTEEFAANVPEYCGVISKNPTTRARIEHVEEAEANFNFDVLEKAVTRRVTQSILKVMDVNQPIHNIRIISEPEPGAVIIDIRHPTEVEIRPLKVGNHSLLTLPFFNLHREIGALDKSQHYLLYCEKGVMSRLQADSMLNNGFTQVNLFKPSDET